MNIVQRLYKIYINRCKFFYTFVICFLIFESKNILFSEDSIDYYSRSILIDSNDIDAFFSRGYAYFIKNDYENAIRDFSISIRRNSKDLLSYFYRGRSYYQQKSFLNAMHDFSKVLTLNPKHLKSVYYMAKTKSKIKDYDGALSYLDKAIQLKPDMVQAIVFRAKIKTKLKDYKGALMDYQDALEIDPSNPNTLNNYSWMLLNSNDNDLKNSKLALSLAKDAVIRDSSNPYFYDTLACAYSENNDFDKAVEAAIKAFKLKPQDEYRERIKIFQNKISYSEHLQERFLKEKQLQEQALIEKKKLNQLWESIVSKNKEIIDNNKKNISLNKAYPAKIDK